ncbi:hypothetical protein ATO1_24855 [Phaeobacter sp. 22II1-1F12B]|nr:hypothetical protein ATO1_24855 [Phaeobacter sp. 22II1-1F12B]
MLYDAQKVARAESLVIMVGGALSDRKIFGGTEAWGADGRVALVHYRLPGMDGLPLDHRLGIEDAAAQIRTFLAEHDRKRIRLLGYSTGGPVVLSAASKLTGDVRAAVLSPAVERAGGLATVFRGTLDILHATITSGSLNRDTVWSEYYKTLLYGQKGRVDPSKKENIRRISAKQAANIIAPDSDFQAAHTKNLSRWRIPDAMTLSDKAVRFYIGSEDPVFSRRQTQLFASRLGVVDVVEYAEQGHLLFFTCPAIFDDIAAFFEL